MNKKIMSGILAVSMLLTGCSGISQSDYDSLVSENSDLKAKNEQLNATYDAQSKKYNALESDYEKLESDYNDLSSQNQTLQSNLDDITEKTSDWLTYDQTQKEAAQAQADADQANAEAEKIEAEARLKSANQQLSQAEIEEQRRLTEGTTVYEDSNVKINYYKTGTNPRLSYYESVVFLVENKTNGVITFQADSISLDGMEIGNISMSDPISPQSKGYIYADVNNVSLNRSPKTISGQLKVIDFDNTAFSTSWRDESYEALFINVPIG